MRVLVVEDDRDLREVIRRGLEEEGFEVTAVSTGHAGLESLAASPADLLVIDIGLPDSDGRDVCQALRSRGVTAPVIFLTALDAVPDRLSGFRAGGDDYLTKPFAFAELVARLSALAGRDGVGAGAPLGDLRLDPLTHAVAAGGVTVALTPTEFRLLGALAGRPRQAVRRRELTHAAWPDGAIVHDNTLDVYIARLRKKLARLPEEAEIDTVHRVGYRLK